MTVKWIQQDLKSSVAKCDGWVCKQCSGIRKFSIVEAIYSEKLSSKEIVEITSLQNLCP